LSFGLLLGQPEQRAALQVGSGPILFVWGVITYRDANSRTTEKPNSDLKSAGAMGWQEDYRMTVSPHGDRASEGGGQAEK
jgi:hypothetical protein